MTAHTWPVRLEFSRSARTLVVTFDDGLTVTLPFAHLRRNSPSADVQGHAGGPKPPTPVIPPDLTIERAEPVGRYAVRLFFSDGHSSGLFTWPYLRQLGTAQAPSGAAS